MPLISVQQAIAGIDVERVDDVRAHPLGLKVECSDGTTRRYVRAGAAVAQYDALVQDFAEGVFDWQPVAAADTTVLGVCPVAGVADNYFFWAIIAGPAFVKVAATIVVGAPLVPVATAGTLDDTAATAANALAMSSGVGVVAVLDDSPSAGIAKVYLS